MKLQYTSWWLRWFVLLVALAMPEFLAAQTQTQSKMFDTKHNLSAGGPGDLRAMNESDLCVFCHTPHVPKEQSASQLWNHQASTANYELYSSEYLTKLGYTSPNQPNPRSKLCLSCHDGTVALGTVYNLGGSARTITMQDGVTTMPAHRTSHIGTSLKDDHPVGYIYDNSKDPELVSRPWPWNTPVKLDPDAPTGTMECITCHEPHDNRFSKFLRMDNTNAALCNFCHMKTGWANSIHNTSMQTTVLPEGTTTTVGEQACRSCHKSHGGEGVPYLLTKVEEQTCFTSGCHGHTTPGVNTKNIESEYEKIYSHPTISTMGKHLNPDDETSLGSGSRHAECQDCHNSHQAKKGLHTLGTNTVSGSLAGVRGVIPAPVNAWDQPSTYTKVEQSTQENQICFTCHSSYAFGIVPNGVTTIMGPSGVNLTDQAMEFNPANKSAHPVRVSSNNQTGATFPKALAVTQMTNEWNNVGTQTMYCSDCHGNDQSTSNTTPQGPHGSNTRFMLTGRGKFWPTNAFGTLWSLDDIKNNSNNWQNDLFCTNCHTLATVGMFENNVHNAAQHQGADVKCVTCHVAVPHGSKRSRLIGYETDVAPYNYNGINTYDKLVITGFEKANNPATYTVNSCSMNGVCHGARSGIYEP